MVKLSLYGLYPDNIWWLSWQNIVVTLTLYGFFPGIIWLLSWKDLLVILKISGGYPENIWFVSWIWFRGILALYIGKSWQYLVVILIYTKSWRCYRRCPCYFFLQMCKFFGLHAFIQVIEHVITQIFAFFCALLVQILCANFVY